jgi:hypothetical protein
MVHSRRCTSKDSNQFPVPGHTECGRWPILSWVHSLALSKWSDGAANSQNHSTLLHTWQIPGEENLDLVKARSKLFGPWYLTVLTDPSLNRFYAQFWPRVTEKIFYLLILFVKMDK